MATQAVTKRAVPHRCVVNSIASSDRSRERLGCNDVLSLDDCCRWVRFADGLEITERWDKQGERRCLKGALHKSPSSRQRRFIQHSLN